MKRIVALVALMLCSRAIGWAQITIEGVPFAEASIPYGDKFKAFVVADKENLSIRLQGSASAQVMTYEKKANNATRVTSATYNNGSWTIPSPQLNCGYFLNDGVSLPNYYWLIDYSKYPFPTDRLTAKPSDTDACLSVELTAEPLFPSFLCYTPDGIELPIQRKYIISFEDIEYNEETKSFSPRENQTEVIPEEGKLSLLSSRTNTAYRIVGDQFTALLGVKLPNILSNTINSQRLEVHPSYQLEGANSEANKQELPKELSAPAVVTLDAIANEPVAALYSWKIVSGVEENASAPIVMQYNGKSTSYTFDKVGSYTIILEVATRDGHCSQKSTPITVNVQTSTLEVPNAFSPTSSPGINDTFRVLHKSIVSFNGYIFNEWGHQLFHWTNPDIGWDGTFNGKYVESGVYYYVIQAKGADGKEYDLKGNINILQSDLQEQMPNI